MDSIRKSPEPSIRHNPSHAKIKLETKKNGLKMYNRLVRTQLKRFYGIASGTSWIRGAKTTWMISELLMI